MISKVGKRGSVFWSEVRSGVQCAQEKWRHIGWSRVEMNVTSEKEERHVV